MSTTARTTQRKARIDTQNRKAKQRYRLEKLAEHHRQHGPVRVLMRAGKWLDPPAQIEIPRFVRIISPRGDKIRMAIEPLNATESIQRDIAKVMSLNFRNRNGLNDITDTRIESHVAAP